MALFVAAELTLAMSIPFLAIAGYHALLDSRAGRFVEQPNEHDPGWRALVDPSPLTAVVETDRGEITGIGLLAGTVSGGMGGTIILVPGAVLVDGEPLSARLPADAVAALSGALRLRVNAIEHVDTLRWSAILGDKTYEVANPDPVLDELGQPLLSVGPMLVGGDNAALFLGRTAPGADPVTLLFRRRLFWSALLADPPESQSPDSADPLLAAIDAVVGSSARVVDLPLLGERDAPLLDLEATEALVRDVVAVPAGAHPGDRLQVRVIDRTGVADLTAIAAEVASTGSEVVEIGNAPEFDGGLTHLVVPNGLDDPGIGELALLTGATTVQDDDVDVDAVVTLLIGADFIASR